MNIQMKNEYRYEIELSKEELKNLDITYEELDYGNVETRRVLWTLLDEIRKNCRIEPDMSGKLLIEAKNFPDGRCLICYTFLPCRKNSSVKQLVKSSEKPVLVWFENIDAAARAAKCCRFKGKSVLYEKDGKYAVIFYAIGEEKRRLNIILNEFSDNVEENAGDIFVCEEYWHCIEANNAVEKLAMLA